MVLKENLAYREPQKPTGGGREDIGDDAGLEDAAEPLKATERSFLNWAGKEEQLSFDLPTLKPFIHERPRRGE